MVFDLETRSDAGLVASHKRGEFAAIFFTCPSQFLIMVREPSPVMFDHLYSLSDRGEYDELIRHIREHDDEEVRYGAAGVLSESVDGFEAEMTPATRKALVQAVLNDPSDAVRANVVRTLLHIDESMVDNIITRLEATPEATPTETPYPLILTKWHGTRWAELRFLAVAASVHGPRAGHRPANLAHRPDLRAVGARSGRTEARLIPPPSPAPG